MKKATLELSMGFIVTIIISIVVLGFGIAFVYRMYNSTIPMPKSLDKQISDAIASSLAPGNRCYIPFSSQKVPRKSAKGFGVGILNTIPGKKYFHVDYKLSKFVNPEGVSESVPTANFKIMFPEQDVIVKNNEKKSLMLVFVAERAAKRGSYFIDVNICSSSSGFPAHCDSSNKYCPTQKIVVTVV